MSSWLVIVVGALFLTLTDRALGLLPMPLTWQWVVHQVLTMSLGAWYWRQFTREKANEHKHRN